MATVRMNFKQWYERLDRPVLVDLVGRILKMDRDEVVRAIRAGRLRVCTFKADNGKVYRMVPWVDIERYGKNPLTLNRSSQALQRMMAA